MAREFTNYGIRVVIIVPGLFETSMLANLSPEINESLNKKENIMGKGYVHVLTGNGKGKTTSAIGFAIRAAGAGFKIFFGQFVKNGDNY